MEEERRKEEKPGMLLSKTTGTRRRPSAKRGWGDREERRYAYAAEWLEEGRGEEGDNDGTARFLYS